MLWGGNVMKDYYSILGISEYAKVDEIKSAYRALVKIWHPDICSLKNAKERFVEISEAYEVLSNETKRKQYDDIRNCETHEQPETFANMTVGAKVFTAFTRTFMLLFIIVSILFISVIAYDIYHRINEDSPLRYNYQMSR